MTRIGIWTAIVTIGLQAHGFSQEPSFTEGFEGELTEWVLGDTGASPLELVDDPVCEGATSAYSGPPGNRNVVKWTLPLRLVGRLEVWFYDDMVSPKQQIAAASGVPGELMAIVTWSTPYYQYRVTTTYHDTPIKRSKGWHLFAWECDGRETVASIDGTDIHTNRGMGRIREISLGSFWDDSTGWYDDLRAFRRTPTHAGALIEAEDAFEQSGGRIEICEKNGASEMAFRMWDKPGHALEWAMGAGADGPRTLLAKYATGSASATRRVEIGGAAAELKVSNTGGWDQWEYVGVPVTVEGGTNVVRMVNAGGSLNLDWLALAPPGVDAKAYGELLDTWLRGAPWLEAATARIREKADALDVALPEQTALPSLAMSLPSQAELPGLGAGVRDALSEAVGEIVAAELPKLEGIYRTRAAKPLGEETELSREYYERLLRYVRLTDPRIVEWPHATGCRYHKEDGSNEWAVRQNATVALGYSTLLQGDYDESISRVPREQIARDLNEICRYLAITHGANFLPTGDGKQWGDQWQSAFWARIAGTAAWLGWEHLDEDVKLMTARMVEHEADRFNERKPDSGVLHDTKAEENGWNSEVIALAACMFPDHPNNALWQERAIVYMINSLTREADLTEERAVDGKPVRDRVTAVTVHPDFTLENHNRVHPDYMGTIGLMLRNGLVYPRAGLELPESTFYNVGEVWGVLKGLIARNGSYFYVNGQDWWPHRHDGPITCGGFMNALTGDPDAAFIERATLEFTGRMHARFDDGSLWDTREYNYRNAEEEMIARYSELYMLHRLYDDGPEPPSAEAFHQTRSGVRVFERGGFVTHRTPTKFCSFAWVNGAMGLVYPSGDTWFTSPSERGMIGRIACEGVKDTTPVVEARVLNAADDGFALAATISRCEGKVGQTIALFSLPGEPCIYMERLAARADVTVHEVATGTATILNEDAPGIHRNRRTIWHAESAEDVQGAGGRAPLLLEWDTHWANVDGKLGVVSTSGAMAYRNASGYARSRLEEELIANHVMGIGAVGDGQEISAFVVAFLPNDAPDATKKRVLEWERDGDLIAARLGDIIVVANLGREKAEGDLFGNHVELDVLETMVSD